MRNYIKVELQPDNDWIITGFQTTAPATPYIEVDDSMLDIAAYLVFGIHLRGLNGYIQNHLAVTPGHVIWSLMLMSNFQTIL